MITNNQARITDIIILVLEELFEKAEDPSERKFISKRIDYYTHRWGDLKAGLNKPLSESELEEYKFILESYFAEFEQDLGSDDDKFRSCYMRALKEIQKGITLHG